MLSWRPSPMQWFVMWAIVAAAGYLWLTDKHLSTYRTPDVNARSAVFVLFVGALLVWQLQGHSLRIAFRVSRRMLLYIVVIGMISAGAAWWLVERARSARVTLDPAEVSPAR